MESFQKDRSIIQIPLPIHFRKQSDGYIRWMQQLKGMFFFRNQEEVFDCYLITLNQDVYINFNTKSKLSFEFAQWLVKAAPKNITDKKRRFFKPQ